MPALPLRRNSFRLTELGESSALPVAYGAADGGEAVRPVGPLPAPVAAIIEPGQCNLLRGAWATQHENWRSGVTVDGGRIVANGSAKLSDSLEINRNTGSEPLGPAVALQPIDR